MLMADGRNIRNTVNKKNKTSGLLSGAFPDAESLKSAEVRREIVLQIRHARQRGVHVTPTVAVNGHFDSQISSSWTAEQWIARIKEISEGRA